MMNSVRQAPATRESARQQAAAIMVALPDKNLQEVFESATAADGFRTLVAGAGRHVVEMAGRGRPSLIVMSNNYRDLPGAEVIRRVRGVTGAYLVVLDRGTEEEQRIELLEAGADQILDATLSPRELTARLRSLLRRVRRVAGCAPQTTPAGRSTATARGGSAAVDQGTTPHAATARGAVSAGGAGVTGQAAPVNQVVESDGLRVDIGQHLAWLEGAEVHLTRTEFRILVALMRGRSEGAGRLLTKAELVGVIGAGTADRSALRSLEVHVGNLRRKLGERVREPRWIRTVRSVGYHWMPEVVDAVAAPAAPASSDQNHRAGHLRMVN